MTTNAEVVAAAEALNQRHEEFLGDKDAKVDELIGVAMAAIGTSLVVYNVDDIIGDDVTGSGSSDEAFKTIKKAIESSPADTHIQIVLSNSQTHTIDADISCPLRSSVHFLAAENAGGNRPDETSPIINFVSNIAVKDAGLLFGRWDRGVVVIASGGRISSEFSSGLSSLSTYVSAAHSTFKLNSRLIEDRYSAVSLRLRGCDIDKLHVDGCLASTAHNPIIFGNNDCTLLGLASVWDDVFTNIVRGADGDALSILVNRNL